MLKTIFKIENELLKEGYEMVIGIDEAGRGPLAGPVVACAAAPRNLKMVIGNSGNVGIKADPNYDLLITDYNQIKDSKLIPEKKREKLYEFILQEFHVGVGICDHLTIDRINILEATYLAMKKAISALAWNVERGTQDAPRSTLHAPRSIILVDGNRPIPNCSYNQKTIIGGDRLVKSISAASIVAKVTRDRIMREMHEKYPQYGFDKHKGYGTAFHCERLIEHGPCEIHRQSFEPVRLAGKISL